MRARAHTHTHTPSRAPLAGTAVALAGVFFYSQVKRMTGGKGKGGKSE